MTKNKITMQYKVKKWKIASFFTKLCKVEPHKTKGDPWTWVSIVHIWLMTCFKGYFKSSYSQWLSDQRQAWCSQEVLRGQQIKLILLNLYIKNFGITNDGFIFYYHYPWLQPRNWCSVCRCDRCDNSTWAVLPWHHINTYRISSYSLLPWIVSAHLCTVIKGHST